MFNKSFLIEPRSGFVPFSGVGVAEAETVARLTATPSPSATDWASHAQRQASWEAPAGNGVRRVEMVILGTICGYFTFGLGGLLGLY